MIIDIIRIAINYFILGTSQLKKYNSIIDQIRERVLKFKRTNNVTNIFYRYQKYLNIVKKRSYIKEIYNTLNFINKNN